MYSQNLSSVLEVARNISKHNLYDIKVVLSLLGSISDKLNNLKDLSKSIILVRYLRILSYLSR